jgi:site-specific DNA-methyltransferase (adenine-specific)
MQQGLFETKNYQTPPSSGVPLDAIVSKPLLLHGDCLEMLDKLIADGVMVDAIITDPPFFMPATHYQSRVDWSKSWADTTILASWWKQIVGKAIKVLKPEGHFMAFCNGESYPVFYPAMFPLFDKLKCLVWDKGHVGLGRIWRNQHELIIAGRNKGHLYKQDGKLRADVFTFKATPSKQRNHPVEKPVDMLKWLIDSVTEEGGTVLDLFMGGGSTGEAAIKSGRNFIGIELDENYYQIATKRIEAC